MTIRVAIHHRTRYEYDRPVELSPHLVRLRPAPHSRTAIRSYSLKVEPGEHFVNWQQDPFGNYLARFVFPEKTRALSIDVEIVADLAPINPFDFFLEESAEQVPFRYEEQLAQDLSPYLQVQESGPLLKQWLEGVDRTPKQSVSFLVELNQRIQQDIGYLIRLEPGIQTCEETLQAKSGSCRDSGWLLVQILRHLGIAARFVSGYLVQLTADERPLDGPAGPEQDFTDLHAWAEAYLPGAGWVGLDATSGLFAGEGHIPLACTPEPASAAAVTGATDPCESKLVYENAVQRIYEEPRVTRPYTEAQWQSILELGERVDARLEEGDVRLTMGGEPTFVSIDDMEGAEWNTAALGKRKRELAGELLWRLRRRFAENGIVHVGQGKWYPGEPLPRWALSLCWRTDGHALWQDARWLGKDDADHGHDAGHAEKFIGELAGRLGLDKERVVPGYEDVFHNLLREGNLPVNVDPFDSKLGDPLERERLRRQFEQGLDAVVGYALPVKPVPDSDGRRCWKSSPWPFRRGRMYLVPGDSPMGLRMPLDALPWEAPEDRDIDPPADPFDERKPLSKARRRTRRGKAAEEDREIVHTALCVQAREGRLYVFLPPLTKLEDFVELVGHIEATAGKLKAPVILEGYEPPKDERLRHLQVTPDPGVIEVNIHPAASWRELVNNTLALHTDARESRLGTEKFQIDGRHTGTGGGNHVTLGAASAADSPFLRRPDLLASFISFWQNHPSLSYLFSGMFIGPTSQAPRVDEARDDNMYELEIALRLLPHGESKQPWIVDRILRNFLVDLTGNTHRAEFCIDKLYSPDSPVGRRGLVEFRAFEMPPHARMAALQMLLLRALTARFWEAPYRGGLVRWGTELHDRFMLPFYVWRDFRTVLEDLHNSGFTFDPEWFRIFREFRFPKLGSVNVDDMEIELRSAIEPWHVLGEEASAQGTARYVDSSVERIQVRFSGVTGDRYLVACNGRPLPMRATGTRGEYVAGVRFKAWNPPSSLHPTVSSHAPLVFDLVDTANNRSIGGCTYHVSHPGGRNYETFPVNANEAAGRRMARFWAHGHSAGVMHLRPEEAHPDHPYTLDLRYPVAD